MISSADLRNALDNGGATWLGRLIAVAVVRGSHADYGAAEKVFADLACTSHNARWARNQARNHLMLLRASLEWLRKGTVTGNANGSLRLGY
jgi:predicted ATPase